MMVKTIPLFLVLLALVSCKYEQAPTPLLPETKDPGWTERPFISLDTLPDERLEALQACDIIVKPNLNWLPGSSAVPFGIGFGHAAIVIQGSRAGEEARILSDARIFESQARDVAEEFQVRQVAAYASGQDYSTANLNFHPSNLGRYYRLRMELDESQKIAIISYLLEHDAGLSNTRAWKDYGQAGMATGKSNNSSQKEYFYCSLLIWQAFYDVLGIDLDANQGLYVYPNDLINSPFFDQDEPGQQKRIRF